MKKSLLALSLLLSFAVAAQETPLVYSPAPECEAKMLVGPKGTGEFFTIRGTDTHMVAMWACPKADGGWLYENVVWRYGYIPNLPSLSDILAGKSFFSALWAANVVKDLAVSTEEMQTLMDAKIAILAKLPPPPKWVVATNGTITTRPVSSYTVRTLADGSTQIVLDPTTLRATVGQPCDCAALKHAPTSVTYCQIPAAALTPVTAIASVPKPVAVCRLQ